MKKVFCNDELYTAPEITLVEVAIERGFAESFGVDPDEGEWD